MITSRDGSKFFPFSLRNSQLKTKDREYQLITLESLCLNHFQEPLVSSSLSDRDGLCEGCQEIKGKLKSPSIVLKSAP